MRSANEQKNCAAGSASGRRHRDESPPRATNVGGGLALALRFLCFVKDNAEEALRYVQYLGNLLVAARLGKKR